MKFIYSISAVGAALLIGFCCVSGCKKQTASGAVSRTSFEQTTAHLDAGGDFYLYLSTEQWVDGLSGKVSQWRELFAGLPDLEPNGRQDVDAAFDVLTHLIKRSGIEDVSGVGMSSITVDNGLYRSKAFLHHYPGKGSGYLWTMCGSKPHPFAELDLLPANTVLAVSSDVDLAAFWSVIRDETAQFNKASEMMSQMQAAFEKSTGMKWDQALGSLGGQFGVVLTLDSNKQVQVPLPGVQGLQVSEPGLMLLARMKDDTVFNRIDELLQKTAGKQVIRVDKADLKMRTVPVPLPLPMQLRPTVASSAGYLLIATSDALIQEALAVKAGQKPGLKAQEEFKRLARQLPTEGNAFSFVSRHFGETLLELQKQGLEHDSAGTSNAGAAWLKHFLQSQDPSYGYFVGANTAEGWQLVGNGNQGQAKVLLASAVVVPVAAASAMALPALSRAKERAQRINCVNNIKQLCLAEKTWAIDHKDTFSSDLLLAKEEMMSPKILVCPSDTAHKAAADWASFSAENCSYEFLAPGADDSEPSRVMFRCPIHNNIGLVDGSVIQLKREKSDLVKKDGKLYYKPD